MIIISFYKKTINNNDLIQKKKIFSINSFLSHYVLNTLIHKTTINFVLQIF